MAWVIKSVKPDEMSNEDDFAGDFANVNDALCLEIHVNKKNEDQNSIYSQT